MPSQQCTRCGFVWDVNASRNVPELCQSCRARRQSKIGDCIVWHGLYADDMVTPIHDDGEPVLPGKRLCHKVDCVNSSHIERNSNGESQN